MFERPHKQLITERINEPRKFIQVVVGPRQVGKSTIIRQVLNDTDKPYLFYTAEAEANATGAWISSCWANARRKLRQENLPEILLVFDEIQKVTRWSEAVKLEWDMDSFKQVNVKVILLGSSRIMIEKGLSESLMGRFELIKMGHWTYPEMRDAFGFSLDEYMFFGGYPGAAPLVKDQLRWEEYISSSIVDATIHKDILLNATVNKPALLRQTFELGSAYSGELLSYTKMLGVLQDAGNTTTLTDYTHLLDHAGMLTGLQKFAIDEARKRASVPKWQVYDNALKTLFLRRSFPEAFADKKLWGRIVESAVGAYLLNEAFRDRLKVYYWRDGNKEVDFIVQKGDKYIGIEVKSNDDKSTEGMQEFSLRFKPEAMYLVGEAGYPLEEFFLQPLVSLFR